MKMGNLYIRNGERSRREVRHSGSGDERDHPRNFRHVFEDESSRVRINP
eukprot:COSAG03_NODE_7880_length_861_cov_1.603675_1_plen_48_part_10